MAAVQAGRPHAGMAACLALHECGKLTGYCTYYITVYILATGTMVEVVKSPADKREYRYVVLENGLRALLVHDAEMNAVAEDGGEGAFSGSDHESEESTGSKVLVVEHAQACPALPGGVH